MNRSLNQQQQQQPGGNFYRAPQQQHQQQQQPPMNQVQQSPTNSAVLPTSKWGGSQQQQQQQQQAINQVQSPSPQQQQGYNHHHQQYNQFNNNLRRSNEFNTNNYNQQQQQQQLNGSHKGIGIVGSSKSSLSSSNSGVNVAGNPLNTSTGGTNNLNKTKYSKDELLNLYDPNVKIPEPLATHTYILSEEIQPPINLNYDSKRDRNRMQQGTPNMMNRMRKDMTGSTGKPKWANSPSSTSSWRSSRDQVESGDKKIWYYLDPQNNTQGPFSSIDMDQWHNGGYFKPDLLVKRGESGFVKFKKLLNAYGNTAPFTSITTQTDFQKLLKEPNTDIASGSIAPPIGLGGSTNTIASANNNTTTTASSGGSLNDEDLDEQIQPPILESDENDLIMKFKQSINLSQQQQQQQQNIDQQPQPSGLISSLLERAISPSQQVQQQVQQQQQQGSQPSLLQTLLNDNQQVQGNWEDEKNSQQPQQQFDQPSWELMRHLHVQQQLQHQLVQTHNNMQQLTQQYQQLQKQPQTQQTQLQLQQIMQYIQQQQQVHFTLQQQLYQFQVQNHLFQRNLQPQQQQGSQQTQQQQSQQSQQQQQGNQQQFFQHQGYSQFFQNQQFFDQQQQQHDNQSTQTQQIQEPVINETIVEETKVQEPELKEEIEESDFVWGVPQQPKSPLLSVNQEPLDVYENTSIEESVPVPVPIPEPEIQSPTSTSNNNGYTVSLVNPWTATESTKKKSLLEIQQEEMKEQKRKEIEDIKISATEAKQQMNAMKWGGSIPTWSVDSNHHTSSASSFKDIQNEELAISTKNSIEEQQQQQQQLPPTSYPTLSAAVSGAGKVSFSDVMKEQSKEKKVISPSNNTQVNTQTKPNFNPSSPWDKPSANNNSTSPTHSYNSVSSQSTSKPSLSIRTDDLGKVNTTTSNNNNNEFASTSINILPKQTNSSVKTNSVINIKTKQQQQQQSTYSNTPRPDFIKWCHQQLKTLTSMDVNVVTELLCSFKSESEIRECAKDCLGYSTEAERFIGEYLLYRSDEPSLSFESSSPVITIPLKNKGSNKPSNQSPTVSNKSGKGKKK